MDRRLGWAYLLRQIAQDFSSALLRSSLEAGHSGHLVGVTDAITPYVTELQAEAGRTLSLC